MNKVLATIRIDMNGKKIAAIKSWRRVSGSGLTDSKNFIEQFGFGSEIVVMMTELQLGRFMVEAFNDCNGYTDKPYFGVIKVTPTVSTGLDISNNEMR